MSAWENACALFQILKWSVQHEFWKTHPVIDSKDLSAWKGKHAVITGGTRGIGAAIVKKLLEIDMTLVIGCRNPADADKLLAQIRADGVASGSVHAFPLDLTSLASVREFGAKVIAENFPINVLFCNAGIMGGLYKETMDGFESHFQVNYLSHFLLTNLLLPQMQKTSVKTGIRGRIVNVSAALQTYGQINFANLQLKNGYVPLKGYFNTKLMQVLTTEYLSTKLEKEGCNIQVNSLHPGVVATELSGHGASTSWIMQKMMMTVEQGADEVLFVAFSSKMENHSGEFFVYGTPFPAPVTDKKTIGKLWEVSMELTGLAQHT